MALVVALGLAGGLAAILLSGDDEAAAVEVRREPVASAGENPFMQSVSTDEDDDSALTPPPDAGGTFDGATPGLYGGTMHEASCDPDAMVEFLEANPAKAAAWADVLGIRVSDIADYVEGLTSVVLRADTAVTNHGFANGRATAIPAVLQAGTAVLVDDEGTPVVKCYCGNPLTKPTGTERVTYTGTRWPDWRPAEVVTVDPSPAPIVVIALVDPATDRAFGRPVGTDGDDDGPAPDDPTATTTSTTTTTLPPVPTNATYTATFSGTCGAAAPPNPGITVTVADGTITLEAAGGTASGPLGPDGSFSVSAQGDTVTGRVDAETITGTFTGNCTGTVDGTRTG